jgi:phosphoribosylanthranilate isomerase
MAIAIKICGLTTPEAADATIRAGAAFGGLMFFARSPRFLQREQAKALAARLRGRVRIVAVFADASDAEIAEAVDATDPDLLQLHGGETPARVSELRTRFTRPIIKALAVSDRADLEKARAYDAADFFLFDARAPAGATRPGGLGAAFDWTIMSSLSTRRPWLLAGGLTVENVGRAIAMSGAQMVDVSSGVEDKPGHKSPEKIAAFAAAVRAAGAGSETAA